MSSEASFTEEEVWCAARAAEVAECATRMSLDHGRLGEWPAWHVMPYAGIWAIERKDRPEWIGWWAIAGDLPADALAAHDLPAPRDAMRAFAKRWLLDADSIDRGQVPGHWEHVTHDALPKLAAQLRRRGTALGVWADDASAWPPDEA